MVNNGPILLNGTKAYHATALGCLQRTSMRQNVSRSIGTKYGTKYPRFRYLPNIGKATNKPPFVFLLVDRKSYVYLPFGVFFKRGEEI